MCDAVRLCALGHYLINEKANSFRHFQRSWFTKKKKKKTGSPIRDMETFGIGKRDRETERESQSETQSFARHAGWVRWMPKKGIRMVRWSEHIATINWHICTKGYRRVSQSFFPFLFFCVPVVLASSISRARCHAQLFPPGMLGSPIVTQSLLFTSWAGPAINTVTTTRP